MDLTLDEHKLLADFHRLSPEGKKELLDYASFLVRKDQSGEPAEDPGAGNQCSLGKKGEPRPEAAKEPIFTE
ncbi:MAG TPA: hypothetical protein VIU40_13420 [Geobacteraceae bacterium]